MKRNSGVSETMSFVRPQATPLPKQGMKPHHPIEVTFGTGTDFSIGAAPSLSRWGHKIVVAPWC